MNEDITNVLLVFPEAWSKSKRQYVRLTVKSLEDRRSTTGPIWLGRKHDFSPTGNKAKVEYGDDDIRKLESAPDSSILQVRNDKENYKFEKKNGKWVQLTEDE